MRGADHTHTEALILAAEFVAGVWNFLRQPFTSNDFLHGER